MSLPTTTTNPDWIFQVSYSGMVEWTSTAGVFISFQERGQKTSDNTSLTISALTPSTEYVFQVSMVTPEGQGAEVRTVVTTEEEVGGMIYIINSKAIIS